MPKSFAEQINKYQVLISGLKKNKQEIPLTINIANFEKLVNDALTEDKIQEELKSKTQQSTQRLNKLIKEAEEQSRKAISSIHAKYGKKSEKLGKFGLKPIKTGRKKSRKIP